MNLCFTKEKILKTEKFYGGGGRLVALSLAVLGISIFSSGRVAKAGNGNKFLGRVSTSGRVLFKRPHTEISGNKFSYPGDVKRQRVVMSYPGDKFFEDTTLFTWILQSKTGNSTSTIKENVKPTFLGFDGESGGDIFQTTSSSGNITSLTVTGNNSGWYQNRDIIWIDN